MKKQLDFSRCNFYGRLTELSTLVNTYESCRNNGRSQLVMIHGYSGTGKTALVRELRERIVKNEQDEVYFVAGKFDQLRTMKPYSALIDAFVELCNQVVLSDDVDQVTEALAKTTTIAERTNISSIIPNFRQLCQCDIGCHNFASESSIETTPVDSSKNSLNKLIMAFRAFLRATTVSQQPLVLVLDDLQWADTASIDLLLNLATDFKSTNILFIGLYRDNEVDHSHALSRRLTNIEEKRTDLQLVRIHLNNLTKESITDFVADVTDMKRDKAIPLADVIFDKTRGNIFFAIQLLKLLQDQDLLTFCLRRYIWAFDIEQIRSETNISDNIVDLISDKIKRLPNKVKTILLLASYLGSHFDIDALRTIVDAYQFEDKVHEGEIASILDIARSEGLVESKGPVKSGMYKFSHDRIQQGSYLLLPKGRDRDILHLNVGERISTMQVSRQGDEWILFVSTDHLNHAEPYISDGSKRIDLAKKNLKAAQIAINMSAFEPAAKYVRSGIRFLNSDTKWKEHYHLTLQLHTKMAELETCNGNFASSREHAAMVLSNATSFDDKIKVQYVLLDSFNTEGKLQDGLDVAICLLRDLSESFPKRVNKFHILANHKRTERMLKGLTDCDILGLPKIANEEKLAAMNVLDKLYYELYHLDKSKLLFLMNGRMVQLSLQYGLCAPSAIGFVRYGMSLITFGEQEKGYRLGKIGAVLADANAAQDAVAPLIYFAGAIMHWREPLAKTMEPMLRGYKTGMATGRIFDAFQAMHAYCIHYFYSGLPLKPLLPDLEKFGEQAIDYNQNLIFFQLLTVWQCVLNLTGHADNPADLSKGDAMDKKSLFENTHNVGGQQTWSFQMQLSYYFGDFELAADLSSKLQKVDVPSSYYVICVRTLFFCLIAVALERRARQKKTVMNLRRLHERPIVTARRMINRLKQWVGKGAVNCHHKLKLLEAEYKSLVMERAGFEQLKGFYDTAIASSAKTGFLQHHALANELAGICALENGNEYWASGYLSRAYELYCDWNAHGKADHLREKYRSLVKDGQQVVFSSNIKSRSRFKENESRRQEGGMINFSRISTPVE